MIFATLCVRPVASRTRDQMLQAARSGVQNIAEGSQASGTAKKMDLKLTNVARASLEELRLDYEDYLRQRALEEWPPDHPVLKRFKATRCARPEQMRAWVQEEQKLARSSTDTHRPTRTNPSVPGSVKVPEGPCASVSAAQLVAKAALSLLSLCCYLLDRQIATLEKAFVEEGGFTERLYRARSQRRSRA